MKLLPSCLRLYKSQQPTKRVVKKGQLYGDKMQTANPATCAKVKRAIYAQIYAFFYSMFFKLEIDLNKNGWFWGHIPRPAL